MSAHSVGPCAVVDGHYPCIREITGYSFKISIVMSATDLTFEDTLKREADAQLIAAAPNLRAMAGKLMRIIEEYVPDLEDVGDYQMAVALLAEIDGGAA